MPRKKKNDIRIDTVLEIPETTIAMPDEAMVEKELQIQKMQGEFRVLTRKNAELASMLLREQETRRNLESIQGQVDIYDIEPTRRKGKTVATAFAIASDWHVEELVDPDIVNGINAYNIAIAKKRAGQFFEKILRLTRVFGADVTIDNLVLVLLGDFITNDIHEDTARTNLLPPMEAILYAQSLIVAGIIFLLNNSDLRIHIRCHSGNHARTTQKIHHTQEYGYSLEYAMYHSLAKYFSSEKRITFWVSKGYASYQKVYGRTFRYHHGHKIRGGGGIGGIFTPIQKWIKQANNTRSAHYDVLGHFHQYNVAHNFQSNGSLIGWSAYSEAINASFQDPTQIFFIVDNRFRKPIISAPLYFE